MQDNQSTMKLLKNGRTLAGKQLRYNGIRYFWVVDRLEKELVEIEYCPTGMMLVDFFTKPLQRSLFRKMRDVVMGLQPITILKTEYELKEKKSDNTLNGEERSDVPIESVDRIVSTSILYMNSKKVRFALVIVYIER